MGGADLQQFASNPHVEVVAICDVDTVRAAAAAKRCPNARRYQHWRELLDKEGDKVDSVNVSTPDHMHAPITMCAINRGKHVYCQKPLTHDVYEARQIATAAAKARVVTQMGIQINASIQYHYSHWVDACRNKTTTAAGFDYAGPLTEVILLGTVALRCPDQELAWDAKQMKVTNLPQANQYLRRRYRPSWTVEGL